jgi:hypothetical protein
VNRRPRTAGERLALNDYLDRGVLPVPLIVEANRPPGEIDLNRNLGGLQARRPGYEGVVEFDVDHFLVDDVRDDRDRLTELSTGRPDLLSDRFEVPDRRLPDANICQGHRAIPEDEQLPEVLLIPSEFGIGPGRQRRGHVVPPEEDRDRPPRDPLVSRSPDAREPLVTPGVKRQVLHPEPVPERPLKEPPEALQHEVEPDVDGVEEVVDSIPDVGDRVSYAIDEIPDPVSDPLADVPYSVPYAPLRDRSDDDGVLGCNRCVEVLHGFVVDDDEGKVHPRDCESVRDRPRYPGEDFPVGPERVTKNYDFT